MNDRLIDVAVIGGGIAGLAAAYELQQRGVDARLLEATPRPGGVIRTDRVDGWVIDAGPDALLVHKPAALELCRALGLEDRLISTLLPRTAYVLREGRLCRLVEGSYLGFPVGLVALALSPLFSWAGKIRMACEIAIPGAERDEDESIASFVRRRFGGEAVEYLAEPLLAGIHAGDAERLSMSALFPQLLAAERQGGSVLRSARALRMRPSPRGAFVSLPGGIGELVDSVAAALRPGSLQLSSRVTQVRRGPASTSAKASADRKAGHDGPLEFTVESERGALHARAIILTLPGYAAAGVLRGLDTTLSDLCGSMPYASTATVAFGYRRDQIRHPLNGSGFVVPRAESSPLLAATWVTSKWPGRAPGGHALLRAFVGGARDPKRLEDSDDRLIDTAAAALADVLEIDGPPVLTRLYRFPDQSPQYEVGHLQRVEAIEQRAASIPGLFFAGSGVRAIGIPDCIADGRAAATRAAAYAGRVPRRD